MHMVEMKVLLHRF